jgi:2-keto-4-pentenoate hydratase/2-oxohepta-3-ene-1,7-dioic acid hydratase in catechol pathway
MRTEVANVGGRAMLVRNGQLIDIQDRSTGVFPADPMLIFSQWRAFEEWANYQQPRAEDPEVSSDAFLACAPRPRQVFGIGLNYRAHATEADLPIPKQPMVFTKFPSCISAPNAPIVLSSDRVDWEVELVVVIGEGGREIKRADALGRVAGFCVGQDISDRRRQFGDKPPQFSLGKSFPGYGPVGPSVVGLSALPQPEDLWLSCDIDGERVQDARTSDMIFPVSELVSYLSRFVELLPGDLIFTGTPSGVGATRSPRRYLQPDESIRSEIDELGVLENRCLAGPNF